MAHLRRRPPTLVRIPPTQLQLFVLQPTSTSSISSLSCAPAPSVRPLASSSRSHCLCHLAYRRRAYFISRPNRVSPSASLLPASSSRMDLNDPHQAKHPRTAPNRTRSSATTRPAYLIEEIDADTSTTISAKITKAKTAQLAGLAPPGHNAESFYARSKSGSSTTGDHRPRRSPRYGQKPLSTPPLVNSSPPAPKLAWTIDNGESILRTETRPNNCCC